MKIYIETLKRIYEKGKISLEKLNVLLDSGKITNDEFVFIVGEKEEDR